MYRFSFSLLGSTLLAFLAIGGPAPAGAQEDRSAIGVSPPSSCYTHPAGLQAGNYAWDAPACAKARQHWASTRENAAEPKAVVAKALGPDLARPSTSTFMLSNTPAPPATQVDKRGLTFVTVGLSQPPANAQLVWLPKGTLFPVHTMQSYSTFEARPDGKLRFELDQDVVVNGFLVAMKGDTAEGSFPTVMSGRSFLIFRINGSLFQIKVDKIYNFCGDEIDVDFDRTEYRSQRLGSSFAVPSDMDQHIIRGQQYVSFTSRPQRVCGVPTSESGSPLAAAALYPTTH